jgi:hypothetical protein
MDQKTKLNKLTEIENTLKEIKIKTVPEDDDDKTDFYNNLIDIYNTLVDLSKIDNIKDLFGKDNRIIYKRIDIATKECNLLIEKYN